MKQDEVRMKRKVAFLFLAALLLFQFTSSSTTNAQSSFTRILYLPFRVDYVAVSGDGQYFAVVNYTHLSYYSVEGGSLLWWNVSQYDSDHLPFLGVKVSYDGEYVAVGYGPSTPWFGGVGFFDDATSRHGGGQSTTWAHLYSKVAAEVEGRSMDISDDGDYVAVAGTGDTVYYFKGCTSKTGTKISETDPHWNWKKQLVGMVAGELSCLDMTPNGRYIAVGGDNYSQVEGVWDWFWYVGFLDGWADYGSWSLWNFTGVEGLVDDVAVSNDGFGVVTSGRDMDLDRHRILYFGNSPSLSGTLTSSQWQYTEGGWEMMQVGLDSSGNKVAAGGLASATLEFWHNARSITGERTPDWTKDLTIYDLAMSSDGKVAVSTRESGSHYLRVFNSEGYELGSDPIDSSGLVVSISRDGNVIAVCTLSAKSLYLYGFISKPVGGVVLPVDKLMMLVPYMATILVIATATAVLSKKVKH